MNRVLKKIVTIAGVGIFAIFLAVGVTFVANRKATPEQSSLFGRNIMALARREQNQNNFKVYDVSKFCGYHYTEIVQGLWGWVPWYCSFIECVPGGDKECPSGSATDCNCQS